MLSKEFSDLFKITTEGCTTGADSKLLSAFFVSILCWSSVNKITSNQQAQAFLSSITSISILHKCFPFQLIPFDVIVLSH